MAPAAPLIGLVMAVVGLVSLFNSSEAKAAAGAGNPPPKPKDPKSPVKTQDPKASLQKIVDSGNPTKIKQAAALARESGNQRLAANLDRQAVGAKVAHPEGQFRSPFPSVADGQWNRFVKALRGPDPKRVTSALALGLFGFTYPRLADLGLVQNLKRITTTGSDGKRRTATTGDFLPPMTREKFLSDPALQYDVFIKSTRHLAQAIGAKYPEVIGKAQVDGSPVTLSGLIAVAHRAGFTAMGEWLKASPEDRKKHPSTLAIFKQTTGLF